MVCSITLNGLVFCENKLQFSYLFFVRHFISTYLPNSIELAINRTNFISSSLNTGPIEIYTFESFLVIECHWVLVIVKFNTRVKKQCLVILFKFDCKRNVCMMYVFKLWNIHSLSFVQGCHKMSSTFLFRNLNPSSLSKLMCFLSNSAMKILLNSWPKGD